jgi:hypothetical protein
MMAQSHDRNAAWEDDRRRKWPAMTSKLNDNTCDTLLLRYYKTSQRLLSAAIALHIRYSSQAVPHQITGTQPDPFYLHP